jgi:hypothetical protein
MEAIWEWADRTQTGDRAELPLRRRASNGKRSTPMPTIASASSAIASRTAISSSAATPRATRTSSSSTTRSSFWILALGGTLLPPYDFAILDEAHQCEQWASAALTATLSASSVNRVMRRLHRDYHVPAATTPNSTKACAASCRRSRAFRANAIRSPQTRRGRARRGPSGVLPLENWLHANWQAALKRPPDNVAEAERRRDLAMRGVLAHIARSIARACPRTKRSSWVERSEGEARYEVNSAPFDVADYLRTALFARTQSVVLTSATIATGTSFTFLRRALGIDEAQEYVAPSPFDYRTQARLFVAPARLQPERSAFRAPRRAARRRDLRHHERPRVRAVHLVRAAARGLRGGARTPAVSRQAARRAAARGICSTGSGVRRTRCSSRPERSGKASTSSAIRSRA